jgi:chorismate synthase
LRAVISDGDIVLDNPAAVEKSYPPLLYGFPSYGREEPCSSSIAKLSRFSIFGESPRGGHRRLIEGLPAGERDRYRRMEAFSGPRRAPGGSELSTARKESDIPRIVSASIEGRTTGTPLCAVIENRDARSGDFQRTARHAPGRATPTPRPCARRRRMPTAGRRHFSGRLTGAPLRRGAICLQLLERRASRWARTFIRFGAVPDAPWTRFAVTAEELAEISGETPRGTGRRGG